jgi:hypothetical protein
MQFLIAAVAALASFIGLELSKKTLIASAAVLAFVALTLTLSAVITVLYTGIASSLSDPWLLTGVGLFIPSNAGACVSAILAAKLARRIYDLNISGVKVLATA